MSSGTVVEAVGVGFGTSRYRESQHHFSTGWGRRGRNQIGDGKNTWIHKPVVVDETSVRLIIGEGGFIGRRGSDACNDEGNASLDSVIW